MELVERSAFMDALHEKFDIVKGGEGHTVFISGEAGMGKTSLVDGFCKSFKNRCNIYQGSCDALFTPRPLAPLYDILLQVRNGLPENGGDITDRTAFFTSFIQELNNKNETCIIVFEDIHWADEATLDFIKFLARRITQLKCLFILTYRDNEVHSRHPLKNVLGQLNSNSFCRIQLPPLSKEAVDAMAQERGYNGKDVYSISGGNPFYVNEILASYSDGVPENIKDSVLSIYQKLDENTKHIWEILSVLPTAFEVKYLQKMEPGYAEAIENCIEKKILIAEKGKVFFKHELFRRTIEDSLSPLVRVTLNKKILEWFLESFLKNNEIERIIHHAKNANDYDLVVHYAPIAAKHAACVGSHIEAAKLYYTAIEYYQGNDSDLLVQFYELYAYECYLTNQIKEAIIYTSKALNLWEKKDDREKMGNCMWFLSRLWWFDGKRKQAENYASRAVEVLHDQPSSKAKAMSFSNMSQLKMLSDYTDECIHWGEKAIAIANELHDEEVHAHALNSMGSSLMTVPLTMLKGKAFLEKSLAIALEHSYHEHVARAYTALGSNSVTMKDYANAAKTLDEGIQYCEERDLDSLKYYMISWKARLLLERGNWEKALALADGLLKYECILPVVKIGALVVYGTIKLRRGDRDVLPLLLEAKNMSFEAMELQRIIPAMSALLEYEWLTGHIYLTNAEIDNTIAMIKQAGKIPKKSKLLYWLKLARKNYLPADDNFELNGDVNNGMEKNEATYWGRYGCPYEQALAQFEGNEDDMRKAISTMQKLGATAVYEKMKMNMRSSGIKSIPRGIRKSTQSNPALLTSRELDVLQLLKESMQNKEIADRLYISAKTVDHHISSILFKLDVNTRVKAVNEAVKMQILK